MSVIYASAIPENNKSSYGEYDTVDFVLTFENQSLQLGSLRLEGEWEVQQDGTFLNTPTNEDKLIKYDNFVGAHSIIESVQTEMLGDVFENLTDYPRLVKQYSVGRNGLNDLFNASNVCEMKTPVDTMTSVLLQGEEVIHQISTKVRRNPDFSIKPDFLLNSSTQQLPYNRSGPIRLSFNLARLNSVLYGLDVDANTTYAVKDLRLVYKTVPMMENKDPIMLRRRIGIKQSIQSSLANIQVKVPSDSVEAFSASFLIQSQENTARYNNVELDKLPNLKQLQFLFNDQTNASVTYLIKDNSEVIDKFIKALGDTGSNACSVSNMTNNNGYGIGLKMDGGVIDLTNQKFSVQIDSEVSNKEPYLMYMFFHTVISL